jgi:hypothetical protein
VSEKLGGGCSPAKPVSDCHFPANRKKQGISRFWPFLRSEPAGKAGAAWFLDQILKEIIRDFGARKRITDIKPTQDSDPSKGNGSFRLVQQPPLRGTAKD